MPTPSRPLFPKLPTSRAEVESHRDDQLRRLVRHAYEKVAYYRRLFDEHGVRPEDIRTAADLRALPVTDRKTLQELPTEDVIDEDLDPEELSFSRTSGSTGEPFHIWRGRPERQASWILRLRMAASFGVRPHDRQASVTLTEIPDDVVGGASRRHSGSDESSTSIQIDCRLQPSEIAESLAAFEPEVVTGYAGILSRVADAITPHMQERLRPRLIISGGDVLTPDMRDTISRAFGAPVRDSYGSLEFGFFSFDCPEGHGYHVSDDGVILEVLRDGEPVATGEAGEVVVTGLQSYTMPLIRYRLGDVATRGPTPCACGAPWSTIRTIQGRILDYFVRPDGSLVHAYDLLMCIVGEKEWIQRHRLVQERKDRVVLEVIPFRDPSPEERARILDPMAERMGPGVEVTLRCVEEMELEPSGKFKLSRSLLDPEELGEAGPSANAAVD